MKEVKEVHTPASGASSLPAVGASSPSQPGSPLPHSPSWSVEPAGNQLGEAPLARQTSRWHQALVKVGDHAATTMSCKRAVNKM